MLTPAAPAQPNRTDGNRQQNTVEREASGIQGAGVMDWGAALLSGRCHRLATVFQSGIDDCYLEWLGCFMEWARHERE